MEYFFTYEDWNGERYDAEFKTREEAETHADEVFAEMCQENHEPRNGDTFDEEITIIKFHYDDDGETIEDERTPAVVEYEHYHGDYAEHFRQSDYI